MNSWLIVVIAALTASYLVESTVSILNLKHMRKDLPEEFKDVYDAEKYAKSQEYTKDHIRLDLVADSVQFLLLIAFILWGGFPLLDEIARKATQGMEPGTWRSVVTGLAFFAELFALSEILSLPFILYNTFVLEERYGFNTTTVSVFVADKLKSYLLLLIIGGPVAGAVLYFFYALGSIAWLWAWGFTVAVSLILHFLAPRVIMPLFNKFEPLQEGELKQKVEAYFNKVGFFVKGVYIMDGSKRSTKSNAFFTGFGKTKRIALFDTLVNKHESDEVLSVLAHEAGHYKKKHIWKMIGMEVLKSGIVFYLLSLLLQSHGIFAAFGMEHVSVHAGLVFFFLLYTPISMVLSTAANKLSRKWEYEADGFAAESMEKKEPMIRALKRLSVDNLANLNPHPWYVFMHYSHPPVLERIRALQRY